MAGQSASEVVVASRAGDKRRPEGGAAGWRGATADSLEQVLRTLVGDNEMEKMSLLSFGVTI